MAGQGHQFPGNFQAGAGPMRSGFGAGPMGGQMQAMPNQLAGVMGGQMANPGMVGMGNQMVPPYGATMQSQMATIGMGAQGMGVGVNPGPGGMGPQGMSSQPPVLAAQQGGMGGGGAVPPAAVAPAAPAAPPQNKEFNTASLCKFGQETVQDIVSRTQDVFQNLKAMQPPNGTQHGENSSNDKKAKMQEQLRTIRLLFKRLRLIYEKCNETCQGMEYTHMESLIPIKDEAENKALDERRNTESYKLVLEENRQLTEQVVLKNKQLKEVITNLRTIIWEINVMLTMRKS
ncbi:mediator of RNA polymerase II transcription subunit 30 [Aricia agestis]|uniref:mediator of RNA polymerase II transcription subunit 30 n=1 Tax=Aricia agestis TaxID=91739 RepID=UPI001C209D4E|nr:mediator of RNA polymerase II transcription subunit 30 [Aricia agestis]XP_041974917.1 mediator of RNA polymerase II transcription subunit 30 [Aricia agestis]